MRVCLAENSDREELVALWERSVRATHAFLSDTDIVALRPAVAEDLARRDILWWVLRSDADELLAFLGFGDDRIEALFVDPAQRGRGVGRLLVGLAARLAASDLHVDVNEQNAAAIRFYEANGFATIGRSPTDDAGRPFPLLHMRRAAAAVTAA